MTRLASRSPTTVDVEWLGRLHGPYPEFRGLREAGPVHQAGLGRWVVPRHPDLAELLRFPALGSDFRQAVHRHKLGDGTAAAFFAHILIDRDPPAHTRLRRLVAPAFGPAVARPLTGLLTEDRLLIEQAERSPGPLPKRAIPSVGTYETFGAPDYRRGSGRLADLMRAREAGVRFDLGPTAHKTAVLRGYLCDALTWAPGRK